MYVTTALPGRNAWSNIHKFIENRPLALDKLRDRRNCKSHSALTFGGSNLSQTIDAFTKEELQAEVVLVIVGVEFMSQTWFGSNGVQTIRCLYWYRFLMPCPAQKL